MRRDGNASVLHALNPAARALGLAEGRSQASALAMVPGLATAPADPGGDAQALIRLARWMERFSPIAVADTADALRPGLFLDISGCAHAYGGEPEMLATMCDRLAAIGVTARGAVAASPGAAWALARHGPVAAQVIPPGGDAPALAPLPVAALRLGGDATRLLARFGLTTIGDLGRISRAALARRLRGAGGLDAVLALDRALGFADEPLDPPRAATRFAVRAMFAEPVTATAALAERLPDLARQLAGALAAEGQGARRLQLIAWRVDGSIATLVARFAEPSHDAVHFVRILHDRGLERLDPGFGIDAWALTARRTEPLTARQGDILATQRAGDGVAVLIDRLTARLGPEAVRQPLLQPSWLPERAEGLLPFGNRATAAEPPPQPDRPLLIFDRPEPIETTALIPDGIPVRFQWRRVSRRVVRGSGPERLAPEWWRPPRDAAREPRTRDYYKLEDEGGGRYWVFREGLFGTEDGERRPGWWLHGLFP